MENDLLEKRRYTNNYKLSEKGIEIDSAPSQICKSTNLAETSGSRSGSYQIEIEYALEVATNKHLVKSAKKKYEEGCSLIKLDDPNIGDNVRKEHAVFYLYKTLMDSKCIADCGNTKNVASSPSAVTLQVSDPDNTNNLVPPSSTSAVALSGERNGCEEHTFAMGSSLYQVVELVDGMVTESGVVTDQALENQANSMTGGHSNFYIKQELQSDYEEDHPALLNFCPVSPKPECLFETEHYQNLVIIKNLESLRQPVVQQHQNGGLSQPKGLPTPSTQLIPHPDMEADHRLENIDKRCSTIDRVSVKKEMEHDEYYTHNVIHQPENTENQTSDIITSVKLEENVERVLDSEGRNGKMEGKKEESQKGKMASDEREVVIWNRENTSSEVAAIDDHAENLFGGKRSDSKRTYTESPHAQQKKKQGKFHCDVCGYSTNYKSHLTGHKGIHTQEKPFCCHVCGYATNWKSNLATHMHTHGPSQEKQFACDVCGYRTNWKSRLATHMLTHRPTQEKEFACNVCGYRTNWKSHLATHMRMHTQEKEFACDVCGYRTKWKGNLVTHMRTHRPTQEKEFACDVCGYTTNWKSNLATHMCPHWPTQEKRFACDVCGYMTKWKSNIATHMCPHRPTQEKRFACDICGLSTKSKSTLNSHKRIHSQEKPYICKLCGFSTNWKSGLRVHMRTHSGETPFKCKTCSMEFSDQSNLIKHDKTQHNKNAPIFQCPFCKYSSKDKSLTKKHEICCHTKKYPYKCSLCKHGCMSASILQRHMKNKHKKQK